MPDSLMWRTLAEWGATPVDFLIVFMGFCAVGLFYAMSKHVNSEFERLRSDVKEESSCHRAHTRKELDKAWDELGKANERYHRLDTLNYGMAKAIQSRIKVKLIKEDANGDGDYSVDRSV